jgi:antitoxin (DNA-binding transcriptional repressor) of toxin-antitoxin stability system
MELGDATESLSAYIGKIRTETLIVTSKGKPVAALMPVDAKTDLENLVVTTHPVFRTIMERSEARYRAEGGRTTEEVRARLAMRRKAATPKPRASR